MPNTRPINDSPAVTRWMQDEDRGAVVNVFPIAAATLGSQGEKLSDYRELKEAGAVALSDDGRPILDDHIMREALALAARVGLTVIQHAEDTKISHGNPMNEGVTSFRLGLRGQPAASEWQMVERDIRLASQEGGRLHVAHVSTAKSLDMMRLGRASQVRVTAEVTPHHFLFTEENCQTYDTRYKMNPPLRSAADREAMLGALIDGTIDAIATDHAPHALFEKEVEFDKAAFGITGLEIALAATITTLQHTGKITLSRVVELLSTNPAKIVDLHGRGTLAEGSVADVTIFDPKKRWTYDVTKTRSRSRNCPYDGMQFYGKVRATIVGGRVVFSEL
jgi:dihydroorotase